ncbi:uncharacterized protein LACBIDRAFT_322994 [Laccaria bicolor S238N-H82]|uniref:Predicted protein n=1 Tax=Laccaria bicolor (strain S238N-H82 / ATCC MYA-4686) TaxID=486041 RepID=B0CVT2_LACBS|nr:uncharacterized protein LACBIDRAFT_322994 [Laccaria bicolor S238N-H82]EDR13387.1 predicted protein [Laccaria bicolor S238N-H82]|eukprot:XP_001875885.1 predicted protein [Laccaria bicolor S238N-H82]
MSGIELPPGAVVLTLKELESSLGVLFVGYIVATIAYGFTFFRDFFVVPTHSGFQLIGYRDFAFNISRVSSNVPLTCAVEATYSVWSLYHYLVLLYPFTFGLINATHTYCAAIGLSVSLRSYLDWRFGEAYRPRPSYHLSPLMTYLGIHFDSCICTGTCSDNHEFASLAVHGVKGVIASGQALSAVAGFVTFCALCFYSKSTQDVAIHPLDITALYEDFITYFCARGCAATIVQFGLFFSFLTMPNKAVWMPFYLVASKLFINSLLTLLNSREVHHVHGKIALSSRKTDSTSQSTSIPRSNRYDVVDTKLEVSHTNERDNDDPTGSKAPPLADDDAAVKIPSSWHFSD